MRRSYSVAEAKVNWPAIIELVEAGLEVELTRRGKPVAVVLPPRKLKRLTARFGDAYRDFLKNHSMAEAGLEESFLASTRDKDAGRKKILQAIRATNAPQTDRLTAPAALIRKDRKR